MGCSELFTCSGWNSKSKRREKVLTGRKHQPPPAAAGGHERPSAGHISGSASHARSRRPPRRTGGVDGGSGGACCSDRCARHPHPPSAPAPARTATHPAASRTPTVGFPSFRRERARCPLFRKIADRS
ncbi:hypothetical protein EVAR_4473_1 [Eumeta japonica]|uniref:Uncharacterized protein n=1 Tax=Eumeta variegata TaxID=151549 RepID=A0A4C1T0J8_EUMVA|nr:hypothetical protein EVAR_4473_1 [Eumeta japonica]